jgi:hypothetical protein
MKFANATNLDRKSGVAQGRDLLFHFRDSECTVGRSPPASASPLTQTADPSTALRSGRDDKV